MVVRQREHVRRLTDLKHDDQDNDNTDKAVADAAKSGGEQMDADQILVRLGVTHGVVHEHQYAQTDKPYCFVVSVRDRGARGAPPEPHLNGLTQVAAAGSDPQTYSSQNDSDAG
eukprot:Sspe_Gene.59582::Locus_32752_Transcript_1_1_Confidence_1.000_Length_663::g.59582::m.59582